MKRLLCVVSLLALTVPAAALAQEHGDKNHGGGGQHAAQGQRGGGGGQHAARPQNGGGQAQQVRAQSRPVAQAPMAGRTNYATRTTRAESATFAARSGGRAANVRRVHAPSFRYPSGYSYRRWSAGSILPSIFLSNYYFYNSWSSVGAYPPPPGYVWVRYGPDLLLVSRHSGRIRDVLYGVFY